MKIERFEDLNCWKEARRLLKMIYGLTKIDYFNNDYGLKHQIQRASLSAMSNIAEGFDGFSNRDFIKFLTYSRRSCSEVQSCLYAALDLKYISQEQFDIHYNQAKNIAKMINGLIKYLRINL